MGLLGRPGQERGDVLGELASGRGRAVRVLDDVVVERLGHGDPAAGEVRVVVEALLGLDARGRIVIARQQRVQIVLFSYSRLEI